MNRDEIALEARKVTCTFAGFRAVDGVDFALRCGERRGVIGPNGAGKSTFFNALTGIVRPSSGTISVMGRDVSGWATHRIARQGVARTFQSARVFAGRSVGDHLLLAAGESARHLSRADLVSRSREALESVGLQDSAQRKADRLSTAERKRLSLAMCLGQRPRVLLLDEPAAGLDDTETHEFDDLLRGLHERYELATVLVEHKLSFVMSFSERVTVLDAGRVISEGTPEQVAEDARVIEAYLGTAA